MGLRDAERPGEASTPVIGRWPIAKPRWVTERTRPLERVMASCGLLTSAELEFVAADDVPNAGVLCALPALLAEGLLRHTRTFYRLPPGFYPLESIFLALALLALVRCRSLEQSRYLSPGVVSRNRRKFRHPKSRPATSASRSIISPSPWKV